MPFFKKVIAVCTYVLFGVVCLAQTKIHGIVVDDHGKAISYANIGIFKKGIGTISNADGSFLLYVPETNKSDTITFSAIGYESLTIPFSQAIRIARPIILREKITMLAEFTISDKRLKPKTAESGNKFWEGPYGVQFLDTLYAGAAMALLINPTLKPAFVVKSRLRVQHNTIGNFKVRLRILSVDSITGLPGEDLFNKSIIIESHVEKGWITVNLSGHLIRIQKPFFLVYEWIIDDAARKILARHFNAYAKDHPEDFFAVTKTINGKKITETENNFHEGLLFGASNHPFSEKSYSCFYRSSSLSEWKKSIYILTARVTLAEVPPTK